MHLFLKIPKVFKIFTAFKAKTIGFYSDHSQKCFHPNIPLNIYRSPLGFHPLSDSAAPGPQLLQSGNMIDFSTLPLQRRKCDGAYIITTEGILLRNISASIGGKTLTSRKPLWISFNDSIGQQLIINGSLNLKPLNVFLENFAEIMPVNRSNDVPFDFDKPSRFNGHYYTYNPISTGAIFTSASILFLCVAILCALRFVFPRQPCSLPSFFRRSPSTLVISEPRVNLPYLQSMM